METPRREAKEVTLSLFSKASKKPTVIKLDENLDVVVGSLCEIPSLVITGFRNDPCRLVIGNFCRFGADVLLDFSWTAEGPADKDARRKTLVIGHGAEIGPRACLTLGAVVGNFGYVPPGGTCTGTVHAYHQLHALPDLRCLARAADATCWWDHFTLAEVRRCKRKVLWVAQQLTPDMIADNLEEVCKPLREVCAPLDGQGVDGAREISITGGEHFIMAYMFHLLKRGRKPRVFLDRNEREDASRAAQFLYAICVSSGIAIDYSGDQRRRERAKHVTQSSGGDMPPSVACFSISQSGRYQKAGSLSFSPVDVPEDL